MSAWLWIEGWNPQAGAPRRAGHRVHDSRGGPLHCLLKVSLKLRFLTDFHSSVVAERKELQRWLGYRLKALDVKIHLLFIIRFIKTTGWAGKRQKQFFTFGLIVTKRLAACHIKENQNYELGCKYSVKFDPAQIGWLVELQNQFFRKPGRSVFFRILAKVGL